MSRALTPAAFAAMQAQQTGEVLLNLIEINYAPGQYLRFVDDTQPVTFSGNLYTPFPFQIQLPDEMDGSIPTATLTIDHVDLSVYQALAPTVTPPTVNATVILASDPGSQVIPTITFTLGSVDGDGTTITASLSLNLAIDEPFPGDFFTPANFPRLFSTVYNT